MHRCGLGYPERDRFGGLIEDVQSPAWAAAAGLALVASRTQASEMRTAMSSQRVQPESSRILFHVFAIVSVVFFDKLLYAFAPVAQDIVRNISRPMARATQHRRKKPWKPSRFGREEITMAEDARQPR